MDSVRFPKIFTGNSSTIISGNESTLQCLHLLLSSTVNELLGDPYYGVGLKRYLFEQNGGTLKDIVIDELYTKICVFIPSVLIERRDIDIWSEGSTMFVKLRVMNRLDYTYNTYNLALMEGEKEQ